MSSIIWMLKCIFFDNRWSTSHFIICYAKALQWVTGAIADISPCQLCLSKWPMVFYNKIKYSVMSVFSRKSLWAPFWCHGIHAWWVLKVVLALKRCSRAIFIRVAQNLIWFFSWDIALKHKVDWQFSVAKPDLLGQLCTILYLSS